ncbi:MAG: hypothetical protein U5K30_13540 [Acidimicrobiales bacterium]|nr:hypothetical protein [Acidimicrobiales bacterium]
MTRTRIAGALVALALLVAGCGDDDDAATTTTLATTTTTTTTTASESTTTEPVSLEQPAIWPAADVVFDTPEDAAADFVEQALGVPATLGDFMQGDSRSGEIEVRSPGEGDASTPVVRSVLFLRQLGPDDAWFVIGAANDNVTIDEPETGSVMAPGPVSVEGVARGFEGTVVVQAFPMGDASTVLDEVVTRGGAMADSEPYLVTLEVSSVSSGDVVTLLVRGGTGLETDPGEFSAVPVVVS